MYTVALRLFVTMLDGVTRPMEKRFQLTALISHTHAKNQVFSSLLFNYLILLFISLFWLFAFFIFLFSHIQLASSVKSYPGIIHFWCAVSTIRPLFSLLHVQTIHLKFKFAVNTTYFRHTMNTISNNSIIVFRMISLVWKWAPVLATGCVSVLKPGMYESNWVQTHR